MKRKINKKSILYALIAICFILVVSVFNIRPTYANTLKDGKAPCERSEYLGFKTVCNDFHCIEEPTNKDGQYFRYRITDICLGYSTIEEYFDECIAQTNKIE